MISACAHKAPRDGPREALATQLGQVAVGGDAKLGRQVLDQHRHQVGDEHHPQEQVAELGATLQVCGEVARVDVGDRRDEGGAEHRERCSQPAACQEFLECARYGDAVRQRDRCALQGGGRSQRGDGVAHRLSPRRAAIGGAITFSRSTFPASVRYRSRPAHAWPSSRTGESTSMRIARGSAPPSVCSRPSTLTSSGPPNGWRSITCKCPPGRTPCWAR